MTRQAGGLRHLESPNFFGAFAAGLLGYVVLSLRRPLAWSMPLWISLAFVAVPLVIGFAIGRVSLPRSGAVAAFTVAAMLMFCYTALGLIRAHAQLESSQEPGQILLIGLVVSAVYGIGAGIVACIANLLRSALARS